MSAWTKEELEAQMAEIVDLLQIPDIAKHGSLGTPVPQLVEEVLQEKDRIIHRLREIPFEKKGVLNFQTEENNMAKEHSKLTKSERYAELLVQGVSPIEAMYRVDVDPPSPGISPRTSYTRWLYVQDAKFRESTQYREQFVRWLEETLIQVEGD